jgi:acetyltransferase-like isoleucine patch superfamily enzyme
VGDNSSIYDNVIIGDNSVIANDCVIGEPLASYYADESYENPATVIGSNSLIRSHSIIYAAANIGSDFSCGHRVTIREYCILGTHCRVGTGCDLQGRLQVGNYCWLQSNVLLGQHTKIGNFVFIYPYVVFTNDPYPPSNICNGATVEDYTQIATSSIILPGIKIGKHSLIGAGAVVTKDVGDYQLCVGNPGKCIKDIRELKSSVTGLPHYPWPNNFNRGMPWEGQDYNEWLNKSDTN